MVIARSDEVPSIQFRQPRASFETKTTMMKSLLTSTLILGAPLFSAALSEPTNFESVSEGLTFEYSEPEGVDRRRILEEVHGGHFEEGESEAITVQTEKARPVTRKLRRVKAPVNKAKKEAGRMDGPLVSLKLCICVGGHH